MKKGDKYGTHRVLNPEGVLPQPARKLDNNFNEMYDNEILCDVSTLNIDSASFAQIKKEAGNDIEKIKEIMFSIVQKYGKHMNPVTGSGGMFIGTVEVIGEALEGKIDLSVGDRIASLVSLSLTPLRIDKIKKVHVKTDQVDVEGKAVLFETGIWAKLPDDMNEKLALAILDVAGAPARTSRLVKAGDTVLIVGAGGKSGLLCACEAKKQISDSGRLIGVTVSDSSIKVMKESGFFDVVIQGSAVDAVKIFREIEAVTRGQLCDVVISNVNIPDCEMTAILSCREGGIVYFFSMVTDFAKAALGAEGVGKDIEMLIGNGYTKNHAEFALNIVRENDFIRRIYTERYG